MPEEGEEETVLEMQVNLLLLIMDFPGVLVAVVGTRQLALVLEAQEIHLQHLQVKVTREQQIALP